MASIFDGRVQILYPYGCFGYTRGNGKTWHGGVDVTCPDQASDNTSIFAVEGGLVVQSRIVNNGIGSGTAEWGHYVTIHGKNTGKFYTYAHLAIRSVVQGQTVLEGDKIGVMGNTGNAAGGYKHVHFEARSVSTGTGIDPTPYLGIKNNVGIYGTKPNNTMEDDDMRKYRVYEVVHAGTDRDAVIKEFKPLKAAAPDEYVLTNAGSDGKWRIGKVVIATESLDSALNNMTEDRFLA